MDIEKTITTISSLEPLLIVGGVAVLVGLAYVFITNIPSITEAISQAIETPMLQTGADTQTKSNNYQNAKVVYTNTTSQYQTALNNLTSQFSNQSPNASIVVSPNNQVESTYGGQPATPQQLAPNSQVLGSVNNPYNYLSGYQGAGYYKLTTTSNKNIVQEIANQYDYNNSYLQTFYNANPSAYT